MRGRELPLSEVFGPTFQGEGPHAGVRCGFVRLGLCNLSCEWCDTAFTWNRDKYDLNETCPPTDISVIHKMIADLDVRMMVLSGGEPMIHVHLLYALMNFGTWEWHVETNGTIDPPDYWPKMVAHTTVSPKLNTHDPKHRRLRPLALQRWSELAWTRSVAFKFVCTGRDDLDAVGEFAAEYDLPPGSVWIMPEGVEPGPLLDRHRDLADAVLDRGWNTSTRLHTLLWGNARGH